MPLASQRLPELRHTMHGRIVIANWVGFLGDGAEPTSRRNWEAPAQWPGARQ